MSLSQEGRAHLDSLLADTEPEPEPAVDEQPAVADIAAKRAILSNLLAASLAKQREERQVAIARKKLAIGAAGPSEKETLQRLIEEYDEKRTWNTVAQVAIVQVTPCKGCGRESRVFTGWMKEQHHRRLAGTRRLIHGEGQHLPLRTELHFQKPTSVCVRCLDSYICQHQAVIPFRRSVA